MCSERRSKQSEKSTRFILNNALRGIVHYERLAYNQTGIEAKIFEKFSVFTYETFLKQGE